MCTYKEGYLCFSEFVVDNGEVEAQFRHVTVVTLQEQQVSEMSPIAISWSNDHAPWKGWDTLGNRVPARDGSSGCMQACVCVVVCGSVW